eukprot:CAMPEP_0195292408 /NCGR_PEP_ID=MMETSP0707-20130614/9319_1 /TAXON_ID=33640 /ORGANISM="Asterionellopsis glacialis, Strain CCMP134" /LENGTH=718 /DNA_ID=CAMNT_0040352867 /DNA_START=317 /DNA_END=2473 /DNA_ORIENTATION=+
MTTSSHPQDASLLKPSPVASRTSSMSHGKTNSLVGFDPLLPVEDCNGSGVWSGKEDYKEDPPIHPLLVPVPVQSKPTSTTKTTSPPRGTGSKLARPNNLMAKAKSTGSVLTNHHRRKSPTSIGNAPPIQQQQQQQQQQQHKKTDSMEQLREIAAALSLEKPLVTTPQEDQLITSWSQSSAGQQQQKKKILHHRRQTSGGNGGDGKHRKARSMGGDIINLMMNNLEEGIVRAPKKQTSSSIPNSPFSTKKKITTTSPLPSSSTTPDNTNRHRKQPSLRSIKKKDKGSGSNSPEQTLAVPTLTPLHGFLTPSDNLAMRSSEQEPSSHQIELPSCDDVLMHGRLCSIMNLYRQVDQNFDFANLVGTTRMSLQGFVCSNTDGNDVGDDDDSFAPSSPTSLLNDRLIQQHTPILQSLLECSSNDDVIVEGFFTNDKSRDAHSRIEVAVFNCQAKRQFIVVYRGTSDQQTKPIRTKEIRKDGRGGASGVVLHPDQPVQVFPSFRESYFCPHLETRVFSLLDTLSERYPFCDVVMTGHSFGGALATIAGLRYASSREMMRVSCHIFGSPKVGGKAWRQTVNSTPNLKVIRIEHGNDPYVNLPSENGMSANPAKIVVNAGGGKDASGGYLHVGHTVVVTSPDNKSNSSGTAIAYRFEKNKPTPKNFLGISLVPKTKDKKVASQHGMETYVRAMEQFARLGFSWVKNYHGEDGKGVTGSGNEKRQMV